MVTTAALWEIIKKKYFGALNAVVGVILKVFLRFLQSSLKVVIKH